MFKLAQFLIQALAHSLLLSHLLYCGVGDAVSEEGSMEGEAVGLLVTVTKCACCMSSSSPWSWFPKNFTVIQNCVVDEGNSTSGLRKVISLY